MARKNPYTNEYSPEYSRAQPYHSDRHDRHEDDRRNAALPPLPPTQSPSPYQQRSNPYSHSYPSQPYSRSSGRSGDEDPFEDPSAVPLSRKKHDSTATVAPMLSREPEDPYVRDADPNQQWQGKQRDGWFTGKITWVVYVLTLVQLIVFIAELIKNGVLTQTPIEIHPSFNPMIGPSPYVLINMGSRYQPCMHAMPGVQNASVRISWPCPNATSTTGNSVSCSLSDLCGFGGVPDPHVGGSVTDRPMPDQWYRFIIPIFLHAGIIHIGFNLLLQMTLGRDVEKLIGSFRFALVYFAAGIFGFVLGGNFAATGISSCGCSGSLFGILAITLLDLLYTWGQRDSPIKDLLFIVVDVLIAFALGLLPGLDNFSHIGGFLMGLVLGVCILRSPSAFSRRQSSDAPYKASRFSGLSIRPIDDRDAGLRGFVREPLGFFRERKPVWWIWWLVRVGALMACLIGFVLLLQNFYKPVPTTCSWCKYLSCLPITVGNTNWCNVGNLDFTPTNGTSNKRDLFVS